MRGADSRNRARARVCVFTRAHACGLYFVPGAADACGRAIFRVTAPLGISLRQRWSPVVRLQTGEKGEMYSDRAHAAVSEFSAPRAKAPLTRKEKKMVPTGQAEVLLSRCQPGALSILAFARGVATRIPPPPLRTGSLIIATLDYLSDRGPVQLHPPLMPGVMIGGPFDVFAHVQNIDSPSPTELSVKWAVLRNAAIPVESPLDFRMFGIVLGDLPFPPGAAPTRPALTGSQDLDGCWQEEQSDVKRQTVATPLAARAVHAMSPPRRKPLSRCQRTGLRLASRAEELMKVKRSKYGAAPELGRGKLEIPEKTRQPVTSARIRESNPDRLGGSQAFWSPRPQGATVVEWLACSPFTMANRVQSPGRVTGFSQVGIVPDDAVGRRVFSGISRENVKVQEGWRGCGSTRRQPASLGGHPVVKICCAAVPGPGRRSVPRMRGGRLGPRRSNTATLSVCLREQRGSEVFLRLISKVLTKPLNSLYQIFARVTPVARLRRSCNTLASDAARLA
ncbi:hypothetical protein PR048_000321 [Dryococelus australis]|uniref:Uncharacterized protein n=1 Tax=Dryococelus australis TaxID=614101 RepID=A0ABQ9IEV8_9NEOP|nr:hypothetical protein PR048_000321 [Dryococelus australis]